MGVSKVYSCDLCGLAQPRDALMRLGVRGPDDRPEDADYVFVGPCCENQPVKEVLAKGAQLRAAVTDG